jgi:pimeloyl-ACP methyl ester carboxylesterase
MALAPIAPDFVEAVEASHRYACEAIERDKEKRGRTTWDICWRVDLRNKQLLATPSQGRSISGAAVLAFKALLDGRSGELSCLVLAEVEPVGFLKPVGRETEKLRAAAEQNTARARLGRGAIVSRAVVAATTTLEIGPLNPHMVEGVWVKRCETADEALEFALSRSKLPPGIVEVSGQLVNLADPRDCDGYPVVFLHGWLNAYDDLWPLISNLRNRFRVIAMDLPGFGTSDAPKSAWGCEEYARHVVNVLEHLGVHKAHFVGHSFGGRIALYTAALYPGTVDKLVLIAPSGLRKPVKTRVHVKRSLSRVARGIGHLGPPGRAIRNVIFHITASRDFKEFVGRHPVMHDITRRVIKQDIAPRLAQVGAPALILWGSEDEELWVKQGRRMTALLRKGGNRDAELHVYRNRGHWLHLELPWVSHAIRRHFDDGFPFDPTPPRFAPPPNGPAPSTGELQGGADAGS